MSSIYHLVDKKPILEGDELYPELEAMAQYLVNSGKLRIDAGIASNCVRITIPSLNTSLAFSVREIENSRLRKQTLRSLYILWFNKLHNKAEAVNKAKESFDLLVKEAKLLVPLDIEKELKIARIIVQTIHPIVIHLLLVDQVEFFVTYGHSIGDMLDIPTWKAAGSNSGMQSTDGWDSAIFISCGGDPLGETDKDNPTFGDGYPAMARMMIIGAQEMGHFSDIKRDNLGRQISRYSANFAGTKANETVRLARHSDIKTLKLIEHRLKLIGLNSLITAENNYKFYKKIKGKTITRIWHYIIYSIKRVSFSAKAVTIGYVSIEKFMMKHKFPASLIKVMISDMLFNLDPKADVYRRDNKEHEEAISCIEALARVPQQVIKWGRSETRMFMPELYKIYYREVIPGCIKAYEAISHKKYVNKLSLPKYFLLKKVKNICMKAIKKLKFRRK